MRKRFAQVLVVCVAMVLALLGCAARGATPEFAVERELMSEEPAFAPAPALEQAKAAADSAYGEGNAPSTLPSGATMDRKIIYTVSLELVVQDTEAAFKEIERLAQGMGGFVSQSNMWREEEHPRGSLTVRVPVERLDEALAQFKDLAVNVERESKDSQDVTEEYVDLEARLQNEQRTERELQELLATRSERGKTEEILEVHRELSRVRAEIEQIQGRMTYLDNLTSLATVQISLTPDVLTQPVVVAGWQPKGTALRAVKMLVNALQSLADVAIMFFLLVLPILIVIAIPLVALFFLLRFVVRRSRKGRKARAEAKGAAQG